MATLQELVATTWEKREKKPSDLVKNNNPYLLMLNEKGNVKTIPGGSFIREPVRIDRNRYLQRIDARQEIELGSNPVMNYFDFAPKIYVIPVVMDYLEKAQNQGDAQFLDLLDERLEIADESLENGVEEDLQGDGTSYGGKGFTGIQAYFPTSTGSGSVGGLPRASFPQIKNVSVQADTYFGSATDGSNIESRLRVVKNQVILNGKGPDVLLAGEDFYNYGADSMSAKFRFTRNEKLYDQGFDNYMIENMTALLAKGKVWDGSARIPSKRAYGINLNTIRLKMYRGFNFEPVKERVAVNQLMDAALTVGIGNQTTNNPGVNFVFWEP